MKSCQMTLHTKRPHEYLWLKSIESSKSQVTLSKVMTTESLHKILTKAKMKMNHMYIFIFFGDSFLLITGMQDFLAMLYFHTQVVPGTVFKIHYSWKFK